MSELNRNINRWENIDFWKEDPSRSSPWMQAMGSPIADGKFLWIQTDSNLITMVFIKVTNSHMAHNNSLWLLDIIVH